MHILKQLYLKNFIKSNFNKTPQSQKLPMQLIFLKQDTNLKFYPLKTSEMAFISSA